MPEGIVASLHGDWAIVAQAVDTVFSGAGFILLAEDADAAKRRLWFCRTGSLDEKGYYPRGRAFDERREVRWRKMANRSFVATYLSEDGTQPPAEAGFTLSPLIWETRKTIQRLYGKWSDTANPKGWIEVAVPGVSNAYLQLIGDTPPINEIKDPLKIEAVDYSRNGCVQMTRFCSIKELKAQRGEKHAR